MAKRLKNLQITRVATVDKGANQHAHVLLWKRDDAADGDDLTADLCLKGAGADAFGAALGQQDRSNRWQAMHGAIEQHHQALHGALLRLRDNPDGGDPFKAVHEAVSTAADALKQHPAFKPGKYVAKAGDEPEPEPTPSPGATPGADDPKPPSPGGFFIANPAAGDGATRETSMTTEKVDHAARVAELEAALAKANDEKQAAVEKAAADAKAEAETVAKAERTRIEKLEEANADLAKRLDAQVEKAELAEYVAKAERLYPAVPGSPEEKGAYLRHVEKAMPETLRKSALDQLAAVNAANAASFVETGKAGSGASTGETAAEELTRKAAEFRKADPKLTTKQAMDLVLDADVDLQKRYVEGR